MAAGQTNSWGRHDLSREHNMERNQTEPRQQQRAAEFSCPLSQSALHSDSCCLASDGSLYEGDQVVPSVLRRWVPGGHQRETKPLPPLPDPEELMSDEAADSEVEFFTSDRRRLLPKSCPKAVCRGPRDCGRVNQAYQEGSRRAGARSMALSWPSREDRPAARGSAFWALDQDQRSRCLCPGPDKPSVPPRVPIPPKPPKDREDKPPKIPPRVPLVPPCPPRTPSPKSLPIYINGVMPATQSFAANPQYVSKASQRPQSERAPPAAQLAPCIVPILKDGRQASSTHYILLPPGRGRPVSEPARTGSSAWQSR